MKSRENGSDLVSITVTNVDGRPFKRPPEIFQPGVFLDVSPQEGRGGRKSNLPRKITVASITVPRMDVADEFDRFYAAYDRQISIFGEEDEMWELRGNNGEPTPEVDVHKDWDDYDNKQNPFSYDVAQAAARGEVESFTGKPLQPDSTFTDIRRTDIYHRGIGGNVTVVKGALEQVTVPWGSDEVFEGLVGTWIFRCGTWQNVTPASPGELLDAKLRKAGMDPEARPGPFDNIAAKRRAGTTRRGR